MSTDKAVAPPLPEAVREQREALYQSVYYILSSQQVEDFARRLDRLISDVAEAAAQQARARLEASLETCRETLNAAERAAGVYGTPATLLNYIEASSWRPIGTAPTGEQVWVWDDARGSNPAMLCEMGIWVITYDDAVIHPTHWMPCPAPPTPEDR